MPGASSTSIAGNRLPYAPETLVTVALGYSHPRGLTAQLESVYVGEQYADDLNSIAASSDGQRGLIPSYNVVNLALNWEIRRLTFYATAKNVFDELYLADRARGMIPGPPRLVQVGVSARF